jgi:uncharacterized heparinase superfamily protein
MLLLLDAGSPPPINVSQEAHAGSLAFEMSHGLQRIIVNCGLPGTNKEAWRQVARATAAHSTVVFNDTSSARFLESGSFKRLLGTPIVSGPKDIQVSREDRDDAVILRASHDGYADRFKVVHQRALKLALDGQRLDGEELFLSTDGDMIPQDIADEFAVRFHLHPSVKANKLTDGHGAMLMLPNRAVWTFNGYEDRVEIEESVYLPGSDGPRRAVQIVIYGRARKIPRIHWSLSLATAGNPAGTRRRGEEPELPLAAP